MIDDLVFIGSLMTSSSKLASYVTESNIAAHCENNFEDRLYKAELTKSLSDRTLELELRFNPNCKNWPYMWEGSRFVVIVICYNCIKVAICILYVGGKMKPITL